MHENNGKSRPVRRPDHTPLFFFINSEGFLRHQGACDDVSFRQRAATQQVVTSELAAILNGRQPQPAQMQLYGCTILR